MLSTQPPEFRPERGAPSQPQVWSLSLQTSCLHICPLAGSASECLSAPTCANSLPSGIRTCCSPAACWSFSYKSPLPRGLPCHLGPHTSPLQAGKQAEQSEVGCSARWGTPCLAEVCTQAPAVTWWRPEEKPPHGAQPALWDPQEVSRLRGIPSQRDSLRPRHMGSKGQDRGAEWRGRKWGSYSAARSNSWEPSRLIFHPHVTI